VINFARPKVREILSLAERLGCGPNLEVPPGYYRLETIVLLSDTGLRFKPWDQMRAALRPHKTFPFLKPTSYLFPSINMNESLWAVFVEVTSAPLTDAFKRVCGEMVSFQPFIEASEVLSMMELCTIDLNRYVASKCGVEPTVAAMEAFGLTASVLVSMMRVPPYIRRRCAFCTGAFDSISNIAEPIGDHVTTVNDLGAITTGSTILPDLPSLFVHPVAKTYCVWNTVRVGSRGYSHALDRDEKREFFQRVVSDVSSAGKDALVYYHLTESDMERGSDLGWHCHVAVSTKDVIKVRCNLELIDMKWCDYIILCGCFKMVLKLCNATRSNQKLTKPTELPFPTSHVMVRVNDGTLSGKLAAGSMCLQQLIMCGVFPTNLLVGNRHHDRRDGEERNYKQQIWFRLYVFLTRWDWKNSVFYQWLMSDTLRVHPGWRHLFDSQDQLPWTELTARDLVGLERDWYKME